jgi:hypothetical protein
LVVGCFAARLQERLIEQLYEADKAEEQVVQRRIDSLTENVRAEVLEEHAGRFQATASELEYRELAVAERETAVTAREREATPAYRARFAAAGAAMVAVADVLIRVVA